MCQRILNLLIVVLIVPLLCVTHPAPGLLCHGHVIGVKYLYEFVTEMIMNNNDYREPTGFGATGEVTVTNVWNDGSGLLLKMTLNWVQFKSRSGAKFGDAPKVSDWTKPMYVHINSDGEVMNVHVHESDTVTSVNLKKSFVSHLRSKKPQTPPKSSIIDWTQSDRTITKKGQTSNIDHSSLLSPDVFDEWTVTAQLSSEHPIVTHAFGWQNVTLQSRIYSHAHSKLHHTFSLKLKSETDSAPDTITAKTAKDAIATIGEKFVVSPSVKLDPETKTCHNCKALKSVVKDFVDVLGAESSAKIPMTIAYLKLLERVRVGGPGAGKDDIVALLKQYKRKREIIDTLLDVFAGARTEQSIAAALEYLSLPKTDDVDAGERFLVLLAASAMTSSQMGMTSSAPVSSDAIVDAILKESLVPKWKSHKLKHTALLILGTLIKAHTMNHHDEELKEKVIKHLIQELDACRDSECRVVVLHAIGNSGVMTHDVFQAIKKFALSGKRESITAMKALRECLQHAALDDQLIVRLRNLLLRVVYDQEQETTSRIIAAELIARNLKDEKTAKELIKRLPAFGNNELATIIWSRAFSGASTITSAHNNWHLHSTTFNGSSAAFKKVMGGTKTMNASYQIIMELLNRGKLLKESAFDVELTGANGHAQHLLSVGMFARGLSSFAGSEADNAATSSDDESTMAGMSLRIMNFQLRPFVFFTGTGELMGHVWSGTASEPTTAFQGNILLSDYSEEYPLINGFVTEQHVRGVLSLDLSGEIQISLWNRNSHSVVHTKGALLFQGSQTILTSDRTTSASKQFSFGGATQLDFVTDLDFYASPFKMCMQILQPQFTFRHNTRKYEQIQSEELHRRIHRRFYTIAAKSYALHRDNNQMCSVMNP